MQLNQHLHHKRQYKNEEPLWKINRKKSVKIGGRLLTGRSCLKDFDKFSACNNRHHGHFPLNKSVSFKALTALWWLFKIWTQFTIIIASAFSNAICQPGKLRCEISLNVIIRYSILNTPSKSGKVTSPIIILPKYCMILQHVLSASSNTMDDWKLKCTVPKTIITHQQLKHLQTFLFVQSSFVLQD